LNGAWRPRGWVFGQRGVAGLPRSAKKKKLNGCLMVGRKKKKKSRGRKRGENAKLKGLKIPEAIYRAMEHTAKRDWFLRGAKASRNERGKGGREKAKKAT